MTFLAMPAKPSPVDEPRPWTVSVHREPEPALGYWVLIFGKPWRWFYYQLGALAAQQELNEFAAELRRKAVVDCAQQVVVEAADFAAAHSSLCHDCERTSLELGEQIRKKLMEDK